MGKRTWKTQLNNIIAERKIEVFGTLESKLKAEGVQSLYVDMPKWTFVFNENSGTKGDRVFILIGFCRAQWDMQTLISHCQLMHVRLTSKGGYNLDMLVVYGECNAGLRKELWEVIGQVTILSNNLDWIAGGDFNEIRLPSKRVDCGVLDESRAHMNTIQQCNTSLSLRRQADFLHGPTGSAPAPNIHA